MNPVPSASPATLICTFQARSGPGMERAVSSWQIRYHNKVIRYDGFMSADLLPPRSATSHEWTLVVRFQSPAALAKWMAADERSWLASEAEELLAEGTLFKEETARHDETTHAGGVTEIIRSEVHPGMEEAYRHWTRKTQEAQSRFAGFRGVHVIAPAPGQGREWTTLLRFDTEEQLEQWRTSPERSWLLEEAREVIVKTAATRLRSPFPGWVPVHPETGAGPARWKTGLLVLLGLYPVVMLTMHYVAPFVITPHPALSTVLLNVLTVGATTYVTLPLLVAAFDWWLFPAENAEHRIHLKGTFIVLGLLLAEACIFWAAF